MFFLTGETEIAKTEGPRHGREIDVNDVAEYLVGFQDFPRRDHKRSSLRLQTRSVLLIHFDLPGATGNELIEDVRLQSEIDNAADHFRDRCLCLL